jgi:hypothetical protein
VSDGGELICNHGGLIHQIGPLPTPSFPLTRPGELTIMMRLGCAEEKGPTADAVRPRRGVCPRPVATVGPRVARCHLIPFGGWPCPARRACMRRGARWVWSPRCNNCEFSCTSAGDFELVGGSHGLGA